MIDLDRFPARQIKVCNKKSVWCDSNKSLGKIGTDKNNFLHNVLLNHRQVASL